MQSLFSLFTWNHCLVNWQTVNILLFNLESQIYRALIYPQIEMYFKLIYLWHVFYKATMIIPILCIEIIWIYTHIHNMNMHPSYIFIYNCNSKDFDSIKGTYIIDNSCNMWSSLDSPIIVLEHIVSSCMIIWMDWWMNET